MSLSLYHPGFAVGLSAWLRCTAGRGSCLSQRDRLHPVLEMSRTPVSLNQTLDPADSKDGSLGGVRKAVNFPSVRRHNLVHHGQPQPGAVLPGCEIGTKDFGSVLGSHTRTVVPKLEQNLYTDGLDVSAFPKGVYFIDFLEDKKMYRTKFIKE